MLFPIYTTLVLYMHSPLSFYFYCNNLINVLLCRVMSKSTYVCNALQFFERAEINII